MKYVVAGTAGHIDHGKTELVKALTGINPDRLKEEQERGITIDIGFAHLELPDIGVAFVDVPGHERFVKNMLAGACGIDLVLLAIAADESIKPQTREHFDICRLLGVTAGLVALTKADVGDKEFREIVSLEVKDFVKGSFLENAPIIPVSSRTGEGLAELKDALRSVALSAPSRLASGLARLPVDRCFSVRGFGTVVTGTLTSGTLGEGDEVEVIPGGGRGRIRGIEVHNEQVPEALAGQRTAVNIQGLATDEVRRGQVLVQPGTLAPSSMIDARVTVLPDSPIPLEDLSRVRFHAGTSEILARVRTIAGEPIRPGTSGIVQVRLESPVVVVPRDRFILRRYSPARTIAGGIVLDNAPRKHRRGEKGLIEKLEHLASADPEEMLLAFVLEAAERGLSLPALASRCGATPDETRARAEALARRGVLNILPAEPARVISGEALAALAGKILVLLSDYHRKEPLRPGLPREELRARVLPAPPEAFRAAMEKLVSEGQVRSERDLVALATHRVELSKEEGRLGERLESKLRDAGLDPPPVEELLAAEAGARGAAEKILHLMFMEGKLARLPDGRLVHRHAVEHLRRKLYEFRRKSEVIDIASFKGLAGVSRKNAIPLLEFFDAEKVTFRRGNDRVILPER